MTIERAKLHVNCARERLEKARLYMHAVTKGGPADSAALCIRDALSTLDRAAAELEGVRQS